MNRLLLAALLVLALAGLWFLLGRGARPGSIGAAPPAELERLPERVVADLAAPVGQRTELTGTDASSADAPGADPAADPTRTTGNPTMRLRGRVLDAAGEGLPGVPVAFGSAWSAAAAGEPLALSGPGGAFEGEARLGREGGTLRCARDARWVTLRAARVQPQNAAREHALVAAPEIELAGRVSAAGGAPLAGASVRFDVPMAAFAGFPVALDGTVAAPVEGKTGADGRFARLAVPAVAGAELAVHLAGFRAQRLAAPVESRDDLWIELEPLAPGEPWLRGLVVQADGTPARGAKVRLDSLATESAADGTFALEKEWVDPAAPLVAALKGFQPAVLVRAGELLQQEFPPAPVRLVLGGPALSIAGRLLDERGEPCPGWEVSLHDGTVVTLNRVPFDLAEDLARGRKVATESDARGAFELAGLLARDYVVQAYAPDSLLMLRSDPVAAGTADLVLRVPEDARHARIHGRVVGRDGRPVAGAFVRVRLVTASSGGALAFQQGRGVLADEGGGFELVDVPRRFAALEVDGEGVIPAVFELDGRETELVLDVARRCHLRVELGSANAEGDAVPDGVSALDEAGGFLSLYTFQGGGWSSSSRCRLSRAGTHPLAVSEDARTLVFYLGEDELHRVPVTLLPGEVSVVRGVGSGR